MKNKQLFIAVCVILTSSTIFGQTITTITGQAPIRVEVPKNWGKNKFKSDMATYNQPPNCVIISATVNDIEKNGPVTRSVSTIGANSRFVSTQELNSAYSNANNLAASLKIKGKDLADLKAKLDSKFSQYEKIQQQIESSHSIAKLSASVSGSGSGLAFRGGAWYQGDITVRLLCLDDYYRSKTNLDENIKNFIKSYADSISSNNTINRQVNNVNSDNFEDLYTEKKNNNLSLYIIGGLIFVSLLILIFKKR